MKRDGWHHQTALQWAVESGLLTLAEALEESQRRRPASPAEFVFHMVESHGWKQRDIDMFARRWPDALVGKKPTPKGAMNPRKTVASKKNSKEQKVSRKPRTTQARTTQKMKKWNAVTKILDKQEKAGRLKELRRHGEGRTGAGGKKTGSSSGFVARHISGDRPPQGHKYMPGNELGRGGMGLVRSAFDLDLGRRVALKSLQEEHSSNSMMVQGLVSEARLTGQLEHPNIIPVYELGMLPDGKLYYSMKQVKGRHLFDVLHGEDTEESFGQLRLLNVFQSLCMALSFAHSRGVVHRDVKPENVLIGDHGEVYLMDWGIAKSMEEGGDSSVFSGEGVVAGTPEYMSPEQASGDDKDVNHRSDIYALGVMLYEILTGDLPLTFGGESSQLAESKKTVFPTPAEKSPANRLAVTLSDICMGALAVDPEARYQDAKQLWRDIETALEGSKERERALESARRAVALGDEWKAELAKVLTQKKGLTHRIEEAEAMLSPWEPELKRARLWEWRNHVTRLEVVQGRHYTEAYKYYQQALGYVAAMDEALEGLRGLYDLQISAARDDQNLEQLVRFTELRKDMLGEAGEQPGMVSVRTQPPGAELYLFSSVEMGDVPEYDGSHLLGTTPVHNVSLSPGAHLIVARMEGYREGHRVIVVEPGSSRTEVIILQGWAAEVPLVGRSEEIARIRLQHRWVTRERQRRCVLMRGAEGTGKGRVVQQIAQDIAAHPDDHYYLHHSATLYGSMVAYATFAELLRTRIGVSPTDGPDEIRTHLTEQIYFAFTGRAQVSPLEPHQEMEKEMLLSTLSRLPGLHSQSAEDWEGWNETTQRNVHRAVVRWLELMSEHMHIVFILRNTQWIDAASFKLIGEIVEALEGTGLFFLAVEDPGENSFSREFISFHEVVDLESLRKESVGHLFREVWQLPISDELIEATFAYSEGLPYAVERVVRGLMEEKFTAVQDGRVVVNSEGLMRLSGQFDPVRSVERRMKRFAPNVREALQAISLFESRFTESSAAALGIKHAGKVMEVLRRAGFLECDQDDGGFNDILYRFRYPMERKSLRETLDDGTREQLHQRLASWLDETAKGIPNPKWIAEEARHLALAGREADAAIQFERLGELALGRLAYRDALRCFSAARRLVSVEKDMMRLFIRECAIRFEGDLADPGFFAEVRRLFPSMGEREQAQINDWFSGHPLNELES